MGISLNGSSEYLQPFSDNFRTVFGRFRIVSDPFRTVSDCFQTVSDGFGRFRTVFGPFRTVSDRFRTVSDRFRTVSGPFSEIRIASDRFRRRWCAFGPFSDDSTQNFKISNFNWPGLGPVRAVPSVRAVPPSRGQLKFENLPKNRKNRTITTEKERTKTKKKIKF